MKKFFAIALTLTMLLCSTLITAGAAVIPEYETEVGSDIIVEVPDGLLFDFAKVTFTPEKSGCYRLSSYASEERDPYCELFDAATGELLEDADDGDYSSNFCLEYYFEEGKTYWFLIYDFCGKSQFEIGLSCAHYYIDGVCENCGEECSHSALPYNFGLCECGQVFHGTDISEGTLKGLKLYEASVEYLRFVPEVSGAYIISSSSEAEDADPAADVFDSEFMYFDYGDDENELHFSVMNEFEAGKTYYIAVYSYSEFDYEIDITVERASHEASDGTSHKLTYSVEVYSDCATLGYTEGLYCPECDEYVYGHEEIPMDEHFDWDKNGICEICGAEVEVPDCSHICHSDSKIFSFIWDIINFFNRLFGISPFCDCGAFHW